MKKLSFMFCLLLGLILFCNTVWANFYVIAAGKRAKKTILVSPKSTSAESGTALLNALVSITDADDSNTYLILIEPGTYNIGSSSLQMKSYVDIQGSGKNVTSITGTIDDPNSGVVNGVTFAELRFLNVLNHSTGGYTNGIFNYLASPIITNVRVTAFGGNLNSGIYNLSSSPTITNVTVRAFGGNHNFGIYNSSSSPIITNVTVAASGGSNSYGIFNDYSLPVVTNVTATASDSSNNSVGVYADGSSSDVQISHSNISGTTESIIVEPNAAITISKTNLDGAIIAYGTLTADETFHGQIQVEGVGGWNSSGDEAIIGLGNVPGQFYMKAVWGDGLKFGAYAAADALVLKQSTGNVGIGTPIPSEKLEVNGNIKAINLILTTVTPPWADYVFEDNYKLMPLEDVKKFISRNKHLPGMPPAKEVSQNGLNIGKSQTLLLKKVEELTLHLINIDEKMNSMDNEMTLMQKTITNIEQENRMLKSKL